MDQGQSLLPQECARPHPDGIFETSVQRATGDLQVTTEFGDVDGSVGLFVVVVFRLLHDLHGRGDRCGIFHLRRNGQVAGERFDDASLEKVAAGRSRQFLSGKFREDRLQSPVDAGHRARILRTEMMAPRPKFRIGKSAVLAVEKG